MFSYFSQNKGNPAGLFMRDNRIDVACFEKNDQGLSIKQYQQYHYDQSPGYKQLNRIRRDNILNRHQCITSIDIPHYRFIMTTAPKVPDEEMVSALRWQLADMTDFPISESTLDIIDIPGIRSNNGEKSIYVVAAENDAIKTLVDSLCEAKINLKIIDIPELALRNLISLTPKSEQGVCLIWMRQDSGIIVISKNNNLILTRRFDFGYNDVFSESTMHANQLIEELQRSLTFVESHFFNTVIDHIYLCPPPNLTAMRFDEIKSAVNKTMELYQIEQYIECGFDYSNLDSDAYLAIGSGLRDYSDDPTN